MTADEHDKSAASGAREATEIYPFSSGYPQPPGTARGPLPDWQAADQPLPDLPALEQLPDPDALRKAPIGMSKAARFASSKNRRH